MKKMEEPRFTPAQTVQSAIASAKLVEEFLRAEQLADGEKIQITYGDRRKK